MAQGLLDCPVKPDNDSDGKGASQQKTRPGFPERAQLLSAMAAASAAVAE
jgi:hypothetical protein